MTRATNSQPPLRRELGVGPLAGSRVGWPAPFTVIASTACFPPNVPTLLSSTIYIAYVTRYNLGVLRTLRRTEDAPCPDLRSKKYALHDCWRDVMSTWYNRRHSDFVYIVHLTLWSRLGDPFRATRRARQCGLLVGAKGAGT